MTRTIVRPILALSAAFLMCLVTAMPLAAGAAEAPDWTEGDAWAIGKSVDLDAEFAEELNDLQETLEQMIGGAGNAEVNEFDVQAMAGAYVVLKVAEVTDDEVILQGEMAGMFSGQAAVSVSADLDAPGTYQYFEQAPKERRTVTLDVSVDLAAVFEVEVVLQRNDSAVKSVEMGAKASAALDAAMTNFPEIEYDMGANQRTVAYSDFDVEVDFNIFIEVKAEFSPALDIYSFPLEVGDEWTVDSQATITGSYGGLLDVRGLPEDVESDLLDDPLLQEANITSFPVDFAQLVEGDDDLPMHDGVIGPETVDLDPVELNCISAVGVNIGSWYATKYTISVDGGESYYHYYDSDQSFLKSLSQTVKGLLEEMDLPEQLPIEDSALEMEDMSVSEAEQEIQEISDFRAQIAEESSSETDTVGLPLMAMVLVAGLAAAGLLVVAVILLRKKPGAP